MPGSGEVVWVKAGMGLVVYKPGGRAVGETEVVSRACAKGRVTLEGAAMVSSHSRLTPM